MKKGRPQWGGPFSFVSGSTDSVVLLFSDLEDDEGLFAQRGATRVEEQGDLAAAPAFDGDGHAVAEAAADEESTPVVVENPHRKAVLVARKLAMQPMEDRAAVQAATRVGDRDRELLGVLRGFDDHGLRFGQSKFPGPGLLAIPGLVAYAVVDRIGEDFVHDRAEMDPATTLGHVGDGFAQIEDVLVALDRVPNDRHTGFDVPSNPENPSGQEAVDGFEDLLDRKWHRFRENAGEIVLQEFADVLLDRVGGQQDPVDSGALLGDLGQHLYSVASRHRDVAQHHVPRLCQGHGETFFSIACGGDFVTGADQQVLKNLAQGRFVVDDENSGHCADVRLLVRFLERGWMHLLVTSCVHFVIASTGDVSNRLAPLITWAYNHAVTGPVEVATEFEVAEGDAGQRLDRYLRKVLPTVPLSHIFQLVRKGRVRVDGARADGAARLVGGARITLNVRPGELKTSAPVREGASSLRDKVGVIFEDDELLVLDKPAGMAVHPGTGTPPGTTLIERVWQDLGSSDSIFQPALAHRLDRGTSGVVLVAKTRRALLEVQESIRSGSATKEYLALVEGVPSRPSGVVKERLERIDSHSGGAKSIVSEQGSESETHWKIVERFRGYALLDVRILTGRMHQIRAHLASIGHPIVSDERYGTTALPGLKRPFLHAARIALPIHGRRRVFESPLPLELRNAMDRVRGGVA